MHLDELPIEVLHMVCQQEARGSKEHHILRRVNRLFADVAAEYILPCLDLNYARDSIQSTLDFLASNPRIGKGVLGIRFHTDHLPQYATYPEWDEHRHLPYDRYALSEQVPSEDYLEYHRGQGTPRQRRLWGRRFKKAAAEKKGQFSKKELWRAWRRYQELYEDQKLLDETDLLHGKFVELFSLCPCIEEIALNTGDLYGHNTMNSVKSFQETLLTSFLTAASEAQLSLKFVSGGYLSYRFFTQESSTMHNMLPALKRLEDIELTPHPGEPTTPAYRGIEVMSSELRDGQVSRFLTAASSLKSFDFGFPRLSSLTPKVALPQIVGNDHCWESLRTIELRGFETSRSNLTAFLLRHRTLEHICFRNPVLTSNDTWTAALSDTAGKLPQLDTVYFSGRWYSHHDGDLEFTGTGIFNWRYRRAAMYERWFLHGGEAPNSQYSEIELQERDIYDVDDYVPSIISRVSRKKWRSRRD